MTVIMQKNTKVHKEFSKRIVVYKLDIGQIFMYPDLLTICTSLSSSGFRLKYMQNRSVMETSFVLQRRRNKESGSGT